ncbi:hypothetical protein GSS88_04350 [Corynebacterium sp. 3HC-13]|uniref:hypothetical protein n=1 Tax=Corynebacterium poyangense TaxID=2684405 RepID=UPI001CCFBCD5|nr:hypothetical protein [Corynebacterium poyangense]MBZ8177030.1 hypothetical protein [Corynebacterium poyangense]
MLNGQPSPAKAVMLSVTVVSIGAVLGACAKAEPGAAPIQDEDQAVVIGVNVSSMEEMLLGELFKQALDAEGIKTTVQVDSSSTNQTPIALLNKGHVDMAFGCTGELLERLHPSAVADISQKVSGKDEGEAQAKAQEEVYKAVAAALPAMYSLTDPSTAQGCSGEAQQTDVDQKLPENIVLVFRKTSVNRRTYEVMNTVNRTITTDDLEDMLKDAKRNTSISETVSEYLATHNLGGGEDTGRSIKSKDEMTDI